MTRNSKTYLKELGKRLHLETKQVERCPPKLFTIDVTGDGNCAYRALEVAISLNDNYDKITEDHVFRRRLIKRTFMKNFEMRNGHVYWRNKMKKLSVDRKNQILNFLTLINLSGDRQTIVEAIEKAEDGEYLHSSDSAPFLCSLSTEGKYLIFPDKESKLLDRKYNLYEDSDEMFMIRASGDHYKCYFYPTTEKLKSYVEEILYKIYDSFPLVNSFDEIFIPELSILPFFEKKGSGIDKNYILSITGEDSPHYIQKFLEDTHNL
jgi:hypothetical protein